MRQSLQLFASSGAVLVSLFSISTAYAQAPVVVETNTVIRVMAANLTSGNNQRYETSGLNIFKGLKPDIVAIQEFNYASATGLGINTPAAIGEMVDNTFGTNFVYLRESSGTENYTIPNGIISRFPMLASGSWDDVMIPDRGFAWARIDIPGTNDLYMVSVHLKASSGFENTRNTEANNLKALITANFPANARVIVAGDFNTQSRSVTNEPCLATFYTFLSDTPVPTDAESGGNPNTNQNRNRPYDYVMPAFNLTNTLVHVIMPSRTYSNGLVFDSRVYTPLSDVPPVQSGDSGTNGMQHMGVVKDFRITYTVTNYILVPPPSLVMGSPNVIHWQGLGNLTYTVQMKTNLVFANWTTIGTAFSTTTSYSFTNPAAAESEAFYRVTYP